MSYSFNAQGKTAEEAKAAVAAKFDTMLESQAIHAFDRAKAEAAAGAFIDLFPEAPEGQQYNVNVNGSVGWKGTLGADDQVILSAGVGVSVGFVEIPVEEPAPEPAADDAQAEAEHDAAVDAGEKTEDES